MKNFENRSRHTKDAQMNIVNKHPKQIIQSTNPSTGILAIWEDNLGEMRLVYVFLKGVRVCLYMEWQVHIM